MTPPCLNTAIRQRPRQVARPSRVWRRRTRSIIGSDRFTYTASDGTVTSAPTMVNLCVTNNAPVAADQSYSVPENTSENVMAFAGLLDGATDADNDPLTASFYESDKQEAK